MENVTVADLLDFFNGARPEAPVFLDFGEWYKAGEKGFILEAVIEGIRQDKASDIDAL